jgi:hypothetical protein
MVRAYAGYSIVESPYSYRLLTGNSAQNPFKANECYGDISPISQSRIICDSTRNQSSSTSRRVHM